METWHTGRLLVATPQLEDPSFHRTVVLVLDHDEDGALGIVLNRASAVRVHETLAAWTELAADPPVVFGGGPVEPTAIVALGHSAGAVVPEGARPLLEDIRLVDLAEDPAEAVEELSQLRIYAGYAGWAPGQLEEEIEQGAWFSIDATASDVFTVDPDALWREVLRRQPGPLRLLATFPDDPSLN